MEQEALKKALGATPVMEPVDAVKLAYQSEFGCGHLLAPEEECAGWIAQEIRQTQGQENTAPYEDIGGGLCRLNLRCPRVRALPPLLTARMMIRTAQAFQGSLEGFLEKLALVRALCKEGALPFSPERLEEYLAGYLAENTPAGYPPVSHSEAYRAAYGPAYRVVERLYGLALPVIDAVQRRLEREGRAVVVLDGDCGAGKTTLAQALAPLWEAPALPMDDFFLPPGLRTQERLGTPGGNVDYERFRREVLGGLLEQKAAYAAAQKPQPFTYQAYDCQTGTLTPKEIPFSPVVFIEGSYSHHPAFREAYQALNALRIFLWIDPPEQLRRLAARNPAMLPRFQHEWIPLEKAYFQAYDIPGGADIALTI